MKNRFKSYKVMLTLFKLLQAYVEGANVFEPSLCYKLRYLVMKAVKGPQKSGHV